MSLTYNDLQQIRKVVEDTVNPTKGELKALGNDIKEIYDMIADIQKAPASGNTLEKLNIEKRY